MMSKREISHVDKYGNANMVDVSLKPDTKRKAIAIGEIKFNKDTLSVVRENASKKGDVLTVAKIAGINAAKKTSDLIPLCHQLTLTGIDLDFSIDETLPGIKISSTVETTGKTGVEMEALVAVSVAALTIYDMLKAVEKTMIIQNIHLIKKSGGESGNYEINHR